LINDVENNLPTEKVGGIYDVSRFPTLVVAGTEYPFPPPTSSTQAQQFF
jgi:hypothetical protein